MGKKTYSRKSTGIKGVCKVEREKGDVFIAEAYVQRTLFYIGSYKTLSEAIRARECFLENAEISVFSIEDIFRKCAWLGCYDIASAIRAMACGTDKGGVLKTEVLKIKDRFKNAMDSCMRKNKNVLSLESMMKKYAFAIHDVLEKSETAKKCVLAKELTSFVYMQNFIEKNKGEQLCI